MTSTPPSNVIALRPSSRQPKILRDMQLHGRAPDMADSKVSTLLQRWPKPDPVLMELYLRCLGLELVPKVLLPRVQPPKTTIEAVCQ